MGNVRMIDDDQSNKIFARLVNSCEACEVRGASISDLAMRSTTCTNSDKSSRSGMPGLGLADHDGCHADSDRQAPASCDDEVVRLRRRSLAHRANRASHRGCLGRASAESQVDARARDKSGATPRRLVVEEDTIGRVRAISLAVIDHDSASVQLGDAVGRTRVEGRRFTLRLPYLAE